MSAVLVVEEPGLATSLQDLGRVGFQRYGVPVSGALDPVALRLAVALAGGAAPARPAALELRGLGPRLRLEGGSARLALVGANATLEVTRAAGGTVERVAVGPRSWRSVTLADGDRLRVGALGGSVVGSLAVAGGFVATPAMGSLATYVRGGFGGFLGRTLAAGDRLALAMAQAEGPDRAFDSGGLFAAADPTPLRVVLGPQDDRFTPEAIDTLLAAEWRVTPAADRMGLRLDGPRLVHVAGADVVSDGAPPGAIQVPGDGRPILLLADRQTTGGYAKIACVASVDLPRAGRLGPGARLRFVAVTPEAARAALLAEEARVRAALGSIAAAAPLGGVDPARLYDANLISGAVDASADATD